MADLETASSYAAQRPEGESAGALVSTAMNAPGRVRTRLAPLLLGLALAASVLVYWPSLTSGFAFDDYVFLQVTQSSGLGGMLRQAFLDTHHVAGSFRPFAFLLFAGLHALAGQAVLVYHLVFLLAHLISVLLVSRVVRRLTESALAGSIAALIFAVSPVAFTSVSWVAAGLTTAAPMPFILGAWYLALGRRSSAEVRDDRRSTFVWSGALFLVALLLREGSAAFLLPMLLTVYLQRGGNRRAVRPAVLRLAPHILASIAIYAVAFATRRAGSNYGTLDANWPLTLWGHLLRCVIPTQDATGAILGLQTLFALVLIVAPTACVAARRWRSFVLFASHLVVLASFAVIKGGGDARYYYFPAVLLAMALASAAADLRGARWPLRTRRITFAIGLVVILAAVSSWTWTARRSVARWAGWAPYQYQQLVDQIRKEVVDMPTGGRLYLANSILNLDLFNGYYLTYVTEVLWPGRSVNTEYIGISQIPGTRARLGKDERLLVYAPDKYQCADARDGRLVIDPAAGVKVTYGAKPTPASAEVARYGPIGSSHGTVFWETDGMGHERLRIKEPYAADFTSAWLPIVAAATTISIVPSLEKFGYDVIVRGDTVASFGSLNIGASDSTALRRPVAGPFADATVTTPAGVTVEAVAVSPCAPSEAAQQTAQPTAVSDSDSSTVPSTA